MATELQGRVGRDPPSWRGSSRIAAEAEEPQDAMSLDHGLKHQHQQMDEDPNDKKPGWRKFLEYVGPGFLVSLAYLDPGNLETDLQAGANHRYELLWVVLVGLAFALIIQSLAANLGVATGKHLAELCKAEYPKFVKICLWLLAEVAVIAADIPEVIGTAFALNILFHMPVWSGVLITGLSTLLLLGLQRYGARKLELLIATLVFVMAACYFGEMAFVNPPATEVVKGLFIPKLKGTGATGDALAVLGALSQPFSPLRTCALEEDPFDRPRNQCGSNDTKASLIIFATGSMIADISPSLYFLLESGFALFVALLINISVISVSGTVCAAENISQENADRCSDLTLNSAAFLLKNVLGRSSSTIYAIALLASGQSSTITGTYAGQYIMQGFLDIKMKKWARNLLTRCIAIVPSLVVSIIGGSAGSGKLIIIASIIVVSWVLGLGIVGINIYYLSTAYVDWLIHSSLPKVANVFISIFVFPLMAIYVLSVIYLMFRKDTAVTFIDTHGEIEKGSGAGNAAENDCKYSAYELASAPLTLCKPTSWVSKDVLNCVEKRAFFRVPNN
ncbi:hypothetical protein Taro_047444 [Colocasia esculenta]|uniref:Uncharacterized protein n=1 Tax=Colocasia esculenta TaxID=4460 RepID=A0A843WSY6_COLES|nr:hypothetical protein [Colocasia esculenta]